MNPTPPDPQARPWLGTPRAAYVHVPFCVHRCGYCNFTVATGREDLIGSYLLAIGRELAASIEPRSVRSIYLGGGTPTHLSASQLGQLLAQVVQWLPLAEDEDNEFSAEANPADVDAARLDALARFGVNRLSLGVQSFDDEKLRRLERDHRAADITRSVAMARQRFASVSLDLIFACPGESLSGWSADLRRAIDLGPDHVSIYGLTFERGTLFWNRRRRGDLHEVDEDTQAAMYAAAIDALTAAGYEHYEVSNFARPGHRCRHNQVYWAGQPYYAVGPGAARYVDGRRETNHRSTTTYLRRVLAGQSPTAESETLSPEDRAREALVLGLRRIDGVECPAFARQFGYAIDALAGDAIGRFCDLGFLHHDGNHLRLTRRGLFVSDGLWSELLRA